MEKKAVIFDLDGTLWDATERIRETWNGVFARTPGVELRMTRADVCGLMGKTMWEIGETLFPRLSREESQAILDACSEAEIACLRERGAILYDGLEDTLRALSERYGLYIVSNCQCGYIETFLHAHRLERYFADIEMSGRTGWPKGDNIRLLMERNQITRAVYVGDTAGDQRAAAQAGIPFVYAGYGFGHVEAPDAVIERLSDLPVCVRGILEG